jgi:hypothetical protein
MHGVEGLSLGCVEVEHFERYQPQSRVLNPGQDGAGQAALNGIRFDDR